MIEAVRSSRGTPPERNDLQQNDINLESVLSLTHTELGRSLMPRVVFHSRVVSCPKLCILAVSNGPKTLQATRPSKFRQFIILKEHPLTDSHGYFLNPENHRAAV